MALKRKLSEAEEDYSDYDEETCSVTRSDDAVMLGQDVRKRRRGLIEKKRRDRINDSLGELKKLVPSAVEKSSSTKLEKAEILQMTVDYLKTVQNRGDYMDHRSAMEHQLTGFRECAAEVSRYLMSVEGLDAQDPLRLRLMAHLHAFTSRGAAAGMGMAATWPNYPSHQYPSVAPQDKMNTLVGTDNSHVYPSSDHGSQTTSAHLATAYSHPSYAGYSGFSHLTLPSTTGGYHPPSHGKPYRPWGAEMAY